MDVNVLEPPGRRNSRKPVAASVLLIDDDTEFVDKLRYLVESRGYYCRAFSDPAAALSLLGREQFDVVVTDMQMPGISGIQVIDEVREKSPGSLIVVISGCLDQLTELHVRRQGGTVCLPKPLKLSDFFGALSDFRSGGQEREADTET